MARKQKTTRPKKRSSQKTRAQRSEANQRSQPSQAKKRSTSEKRGPAGGKRRAVAASPARNESAEKGVPRWVWAIPPAAGVLVWAWQSQKSDASAGNVQATAAESSSAHTDADRDAATNDPTTQSEGDGADADIPAPKDVAAAPAKACRTASGLASVVLQPGKGGDKPGPLHYTGWTKDGKMFDSSVARGAPASFGVNQVIAGWTEGLQLMTVGEKRRFWISAPCSFAWATAPPSNARLTPCPRAARTTKKHTIVQVGVS